MSQSRDYYYSLNQKPDQTTYKKKEMNQVERSMIKTVNCLQLLSPNQPPSTAFGELMYDSALPSRINRVSIDGMCVIIEIE